MPKAEDKERAREETAITPGIDVAKLKKQDDLVGRNKTRTTVF